MSAKDECACGGGPKLIFACSGAADVGAVADAAGRKLSAEGAGSMYCLAGIGGRVSGIMKTTEAASRILVIDGCSQECAKSCLQQAGFSDFDHLRITDLGMEKGKTPVSTENVFRAAAEAARKLAG